MSCLQTTINAQIHMDDLLRLAWNQTEKSERDACVIAAQTNRTIFLRASEELTVCTSLTKKNRALVQKKGTLFDSSTERWIDKRQIVIQIWAICSPYIECSRSRPGSGTKKLRIRIS